MPNLNWKRLAIIIGFIIIVLAVAYFLFYLFFKEPAPSEPTTDQGDISQLPGAKQGTQPGLVDGVEPAVEDGVLPSDVAPQVVTKIPADVYEGPDLDNIAQGGKTVTATIDYEATTTFTTADNNKDLLLIIQKLVNFINCHQMALKNF